MSSASDKAAQEFVDNLNHNSLIDQLDDSISDWLRANGLPITRENWLMPNYMPDPVPDPWTWEHEDEVPECLREGCLRLLNWTVGKIRAKSVIASRRRRWRGLAGRDLPLGHSPRH